MPAIRKYGGHFVDARDLSRADLEIFQITDPADLSHDTVGVQGIRFPVVPSRIIGLPEMGPPTLQEPICVPINFGFFHFG